MATRKTTAPTTQLRRCSGSTRFGIEPHEAPVAEFPKQPSRKDGLGLMCAVHWKAYVKGLTADRKARQASGEGGAIVAAVDAAIAREAAKAPTKRERRGTPMAHAPKPESPRVRMAREMLAATEKLGGTAYTEAIASDEVQAALETVNGHGEPTAAEGAALDAIATKADPRSEEEIRATEEADAT